jgi:2-(1,2-epoxy-1,2-dihydrophenyl)acetyl-CoA isomerase
MDYKDIILEKEKHIAILMLNRPEKLNAITYDMRQSISHALLELQQDDDIRAIILTGAGKGFCSGADVQLQVIRDAAVSSEQISRKSILELVGSFILSFEVVNKPIIAAINGIAAGVGLTLALVCDIRIASTKSRFSAIWVKRGLIPDGGATYLLPLILGMDKALELAFTGEIIEAEEAERIGLVTRIVPHEELLLRAKELAEKISVNPPIAIEMMKRIMLQRLRSILRDHLIFESYAQNICRGTEDAKEARRAFLEKREPEFKGK